jgi:hypothetical protein
MHKARLGPRQAAPDGNHSPHGIAAAAATVGVAGALLGAWIAGNRFTATPARDSSTSPSGSRLRPAAGDYRGPPVPEGTGPGADPDDQPGPGSAAPVTYRADYPT